MNLNLPSGALAYCLVSGVYLWIVPRWLSTKYKVCVSTSQWGPSPNLNPSTILSIVGENLVCVVLKKAFPGVLRDFPIVICFKIPILHMLVNFAILYAPQPKLNGLSSTLHSIPRYHLSFTFSAASTKTTVCVRYLYLKVKRDNMFCYRNNSKECSDKD